MSRKRRTIGRKKDRKQRRIKYKKGKKKNEGGKELDGHRKESRKEGRTEIPMETLQFTPPICPSSEWRKRLYHWYSSFFRLDEAEGDAAKEGDTDARDTRLQKGQCSDPSR